MSDADSSHGALGASLLDPRSLAQRILSIAEQAKIGPGGRLPTERQFAAELKVSRAEIRHGLALLESAGTVTRIVGRGTFLKPASEMDDQPSIRIPLDDVSPSHVMAVRSLVETHSMPLAVAHATQQDIEEMERCLIGGEESASYSEFEAWDLALHKSLIVATHNPLLLRLYSSVEEARRGQLWGQLKLRSDSPDRRERYIHEHRRFVEAVKSRDTTLAVESMAAHLATVSANLLGNGL
jgi:GntR family uxuAB operon transcriptional repressor